MPGDEETQRLRFHVLGPVRADMDGRPLPLGSPEQRAVLAILLLRGGRPLTTNELVEALWGGRPPARAVDTLNAYLARLRAALEPERTPGSNARLLVSEGDGHAVRVRPDAVDAAVFDRHREEAEAARAAGDLAGAYEHLGAALALWEGTPLSALPGPYAERERARLADLRVAAQEDLFACALALGRDAGAVAALRTLAAEHPLRERPRALLMHALHRAGRQAEALAVFTDARRALERERGRGPGPELTRMHEQVLARDPALTTPAGPLPAAAPDAAAGPDPLPWNDATDAAGAAPDPAGREELAARVRDALTAPAGRPAPVVVLTGPAGAGTTDLALHAAHALHARHPDGLITLDLRGDGPEPLDTDAALDRLLHALGVTDGALPEGTARRTALYRSLLAERRALLLLDDAAGTGQVLPLLPGAPGCAVLVTGRTPDLEVPGAQHLEVSVPEEKEALAMLAALAGDTAAGPAEAARAVVTACGTLPSPCASRRRPPHHPPLPHPRRPRRPAARRAPPPRGAPHRRHPPGRPRHRGRLPRRLRRPRTRTRPRLPDPGPRRRALLRRRLGRRRPGTPPGRRRRSAPRGPDRRRTADLARPRPPPPPRPPPGIRPAAERAHRQPARARRGAAATARPPPRHRRHRPAPRTPRQPRTPPPAPPPRHHRPPPA
ncbi:AfsR/SARP family transcriptional regulator [Streptomyces triculaminicus]|uniref:AfsR/SARP family transcriptional regulator n=1 Tax=Streptomyces triculaminicus TaxID=2816232 RepID=A0A939JML5_9ACTN|nr:BTAD domain-containing putative transcriptional regulator [Streptomyces triculaminicus]MBO0652483.1 AfsR/SARP family transcriptional regulator [Streptomyces triculaminicus]